MFKNGIYILKNDETISIVKAHSKEEAKCKFEKVFKNITGDCIKEAKFDFCDIEVIQTETR